MWDPILTTCCARLWRECTTLTVRLYADHKAWPLEKIAVHVAHEKAPGATPPDLFHRVVTLTGPLDQDQRERLLQIAERCPVHRTLTAGARIATRVRLGDDATDRRGA